uniref:TGc domain-containing protein n=1 Tax=Macrostomum lignano TaxID=282301 RepID=A0A1I8GPD9_9PLAT
MLFFISTIALATGVTPFVLKSIKTGSRTRYFVGTLYLCSFILIGLAIVLNAAMSTATAFVQAEACRYLWDTQSSGNQSKADEFLVPEVNGVLAELRARSAGDPNATEIPITAVGSIQYALQHSCKSNLPLLTALGADRYIDEAVLDKTAETKQFQAKGLAILIREMQAVNLDQLRDEKVTEDLQNLKPFFRTYTSTDFVELQRRLKPRAVSAAELEVQLNEFSRLNERVDKLLPESESSVKQLSTMNSRNAARSLLAVDYLRRYANEVGGMMLTLETEKDVNAVIDEVIVRNQTAASEYKRHIMLGTLAGSVQIGKHIGAKFLSSVVRCGSLHQIYADAVYLPCSLLLQPLSIQCFCIGWLLCSAFVLALVTMAGFCRSNVWLTGIAALRRVESALTGDPEAEHQQLHEQQKLQEVAEHANGNGHVTNQGSGNASTAESKMGSEDPRLRNLRTAKNLRRISLALDYALDHSSSIRERLQSGQYPTPQSLATSQRKLGQPPREDQQQLDDVRQPPPPPFPPRRTKAELLLQFQKQPADIVTIDAQSAEELPQPDDSWASLCQRLYRRCSGDLERLRAAFGFVCAVSNRPGRLVKTESELQLTVYRTLRRMAESTDSKGEDRHSEVFAKLLSEAGIPFQRVLGYKKGAGLAPGFRTPVGGSWFACFVRGEWRLVDIGWAAMAADTDSREFFFLTDPEQFVITHLPCQLDANSDDKSTDSPAVWQLLARPLTKSEFDRMPVYLAGGTAGEFERHSGRLAVLNWPWNVVLGRPGELLELELRETQQRRHLPCRYTSVLRCLSNTIDGRQPGDCSVSRPIRTDRDGVLKFKVEPPWPGKFYLEIRLLTEDDDYQYDDCFVGFALHCPVGCGSGDGGCGFPSGELSEFGPPRSDS